MADAPGPQATHAVAQMLYHQRHGSWGYNPGEDARSIDAYEDAAELLRHALPHLPEYLREIEANHSHA